MSLFARLLGEDELQEVGILSRSAGAFLPFQVPLSDVGSNVDPDKGKADQIKKAHRRAAKRAETRLYLRQVALGEARRPLRCLGD